MSANFESLARRSKPPRWNWFLIPFWIVTICFALFYAVMFGPMTWHVFSHKRIGSQDIALIEAYRVSHGTLPPDLETLGINVSDDGPIFYQRKGDTEYILWFGTTLGESVTYSSKTKIWDE